MALGESAGLKAAHEIHDMVDGAIPDAQKALSQLLEQLNQALITGFGTLERSAGAVCLAAGALPNDITSALDGLTVEIDIPKITITVKKK